jgi:hypothetical protein
MLTVSHFAAFDSLLTMQFVLNLSYTKTMKNALLAMAFVIGTLFVGKSATEHSSGNNVVTAITLTIISLHCIVSLNCCDSRRLARWAWRAAIEAWRAAIEVH